MNDRYALIIATYEYEDPGLRRLTAPARDAESLAEVLADPEIAGFEVTTLINEPHHRVGDAIDAFYRDRRSSDLALLYFTGHGLKDDDGSLYLATASTRRDSLLFTGLTAEAITQAVESSASGQKVLILDCCYGGAYPAGTQTKGDTEVHTLERFQGRGRTVLTASDSTQYTFEGDHLDGAAAPSVFTGFLVDGLRNGDADLDGDGYITLDELYSYVHDHVVDVRPRQRPKKQDDVQERTVIARNIRWLLPDDLRHAIASPIATDRLGALDDLDRLYRTGNEAVRRCVRNEFVRLAEDDSRQVSAAAAARLGSAGTGAGPTIDHADAAILDAVAASPAVAAGVPGSAAAEPPPGPEVRVVGVRVEKGDDGSEQPILLFREIDGVRYLPIWIGSVEATAIALTQQGVVPAAPLTHDLFHDALRALDVRFDRVCIDSFANATFTAWISLNGKRIRARPSDAAALALKAGVPIHVQESVLAETGLVLPDEV